jgi:glucose-6-phosphate 1-dehydrogenase
MKRAGRNAIVIVGVTGDLSTKKLLPGLWHGFVTGRFKTLKIIGVGRRPWSKQDFVEFAHGACKPHESMSDEWETFTKNLHYLEADFENQELENLTPMLDGCTGVVYFLATHPEAFPMLAEKLSKVKAKGFHRIIVEKPFGKNLNTADRLNKQTKQYFGDNVYRIDHYLGKGIVRNILTLRFANSVFEHVWNNSHIQSVRIEQSETSGIGTRKEYYDSTGAIRDMLQSHLLQLLALVAMREPEGKKTVAARKAEVFSHLKPPRPSDVVVGQYATYQSDVGRPSQTESFAAVKAFVNLPEWKGVPFYLSTGKKLSNSEAMVTITFNPTKFANEANPDTLQIMINPEERVKFTFNLHNHDLGKIQPFSMEYCASCEFNPNTPTAYEKLISDAFDGDKSLYTSWAEIRAAWKYADKISAAAANGKLHVYEDGSKGPVEPVEKLFLQKTPLK